MRLIDADALIKETTEFRCVNCDRRKGMKKGKMTFVYEIGDVPCRACDVMDMIDALDEAPTVGGWISVKDRLPERMERYLVVFYPPATCKQVMEVSLCKDGWYRNRIRIADEYITHWMPLPTPPGGDRDDD